MRLLDSLRRVVRWHRRALAALLVAVAVLAGLNTVTARSGGGVPVVVARRTVAAGATVSASDLTIATLPAEMVADDALTDVSQAAGRVAVVELPARQVLTGAVLLGDEGQVGPGQLGLPVSFGTTGAIDLLRVGTRIDVLGPNSSGSGYGVVATGVRVAAIPAVDDSGPLSTGSSRLVLLEVSTAQAAAIASSMSVSALSFAIH